MVHCICFMQMGASQCLTQNNSVEPNSDPYITEEVLEIQYVCQTISKGGMIRYNADCIA